MNTHNPPHNPRIPLGLIAAAGLVLAIPVVGVGVWLWLQWELLAPAVQSALRVLVFGIPIAAAAAASYVGVMAAYNRLARLEIVKADKTIALTQASMQRFPTGLQSLSFHDSSKMLPQSEQEPMSAPQLPPPGVPTFAQLLDQGKIGPGQPLCLGIDAETGKPIAGGWQSLYSVGIGALMGAGKSWLAAFLLAQSAAQGARLIICDLHAGDPESLATRIQALSPAFLCDVAQTPEQILAALKLADDKLQRRIGGYGARWQIIIAVDEWTSLLRTKVGAMLPEFVTNISEEGRKYNVVAMLSAQGWTKDTAGLVRNRLTSHYVLRQRPDEARHQLGLPAASLPPDVRVLPDATGYLLDVRGQLCKVIVPQMTNQDLVRVGTMIPNDGAATAQPFGFHKSTLPPTLPLTPSAGFSDANGTQTGRKVEIASSAAQPGKMASPEATHAAGLFHAGKSTTEIALELRGVDITKGGRAARPIREEIEQLIREGMRQ